MDPSSLLFILAFAAVCAVAIYFGWKQHSQRIAAWAEFASRHGMHAHGLSVEGSYEGLPLHIRTETRGSGKHRYTVTVLRLSTGDSLPPEFSLEREGVGDKILRLFGKQDAEIGDEQFDKHFDLKNLSPATASVLRHKVVQRHLFELANLYQNFSLRGGWIQAERRRVPSTADELEEFTGPALLLAHTLEQASKRTQGWKTA